MVKVRDNLIGKKFGRLTVVKQTDDYNSPKGKRFAQWLCKCDCGKEEYVTVQDRNLKNGNTQSCGCLNKEAIYEARFIGNISNLSGEYGILWTTNTNEEVYFDLQNADKILQHTWYNDGNGYATAKINGHRVRMHDFLGYPWHDHENRNRMDNRAENLRSCTQRENSRNKTKHPGCSSKYIGLCKTQYGTWNARIQTDSGRKYLGSYKTEEDALVARLRAEKEYFGEFAPQKDLFEQYGI